MSNNGPSAPATQPARIDRAMLERAVFADTLIMPVRFDDLDIQWHVNNAAAVVMLQEARIRFTRAMAAPPLGNGLRTVVGAMMIEYANEIAYPGEVEIGSGILRMGNTSYTFAQLIRQNGKPCVYSLVTMVVSDATGARPIPEAVRTVYAERGMIA